jgi:signal transduction histidine kinase
MEVKFTEPNLAYISLILKFIDADRARIYRRLFFKFATKSEKGTRLGLFISKSIVEAHIRIW